MIDAILPALFLSFGGGGILSIYCFVKTEGWLLGLAIWFGSGVMFAFIANQIRIDWDGVLSLLGCASLLVGFYLFAIRFVFLSNQIDHR